MKTCGTCEKKWYNSKVKAFECIALNEMIGKTAECFAWDDDPNWLKKVRKAVKLYQTGKPAEN